MEFNEAQLEAIKSKGTVQVIACAGAGKSTALVERVKKLVEQGIKEEKILTVSFTNASGEDLRKKLSEKGLNNVSVGTFHAIAKSILENLGYENLMKQPNIYSVKREIERITKEKDLNIEDILSWISYQKAYMLSPTSKEYKDKESIYEDYLLKKSFKIYEDYKEKDGSYDFDDWLILLHKELSEGKGRTWEYVMVDEVQDLSYIQHKLVSLLCSTDNIFVIGDCNQCIFEWRAATPDLFENFDKNYENTKVINMNTNYRSCRNIVSAANEFIKPYNKDYDNYKDAVANNQEDGEIRCRIYPDRLIEGLETAKAIKKQIDEGIKPEQIAVIYRNNADVDTVENYLKEMGIKYNISTNISFFDKKEIKGILAILRLIIDSTDDEAFEILFKECRFYPTTYYAGNLVSNLITEAGKKDISLYEAFMEHKWNKPYESKNAQIFLDYISRLKIQREKGIAIGKIIENIIKMFKIKEYIKSKYDSDTIDDKITSLYNITQISYGFKTIEDFISYCCYSSAPSKKKEGAVELTTIFKSKGLEYDYVYLIGLEDEKFPSKRSTEKAEARVFYVGITRAKKGMVVSSIGRSLFYNKYEEVVKIDKVE